MTTPIDHNPEPIQLRGGHTTLDPNLDRLPQFDERSKEFTVRAKLDELGLRHPRSYSWRHVQLDQGNEGACVGFGTTMEAAARPVPVFGDPVRKPPNIKATNDIAHSVYLRAKELDEYPGENYEGTSVLAGMKACVEHGWFGEYRWATGAGVPAAVDDIILSVGYLGPVIMGTDWYEDMYEAVGDEGYLDATGQKVGGHCYLFTRYSTKLDALWTPNSWGGHGQGWVRRSDVELLMGSGGEACIPMQRLFG